MKEKLEVSDYELNESGVIKIVTYLEDRLAGHRIANDHVHADPLLRGNIAEIKILIKKLKPTSKVVGADNKKLRNI